MLDRMVQGSAFSPFFVRLQRLSRLDHEDIAVFEQLCTARQQVKGKTDVLHEGDRPDRLHVLLDGWACRFRMLPDGRRQITAILLPGEICDLDSLFVGTSDYGIATLTPCTFTTIDRAPLRALAVENPAISETLALMLALDNAMLTERNACLGQRSAREHLAHFLCELLLRLRLIEQAGDTSYRLPITQDEIGDVLGLTAIHVNRVLQSLGNDGVIERSARNLTICDFSMLRQIGSFRSNYLHLENAGGADVTGVPGPALSRPMLGNMEGHVADV